MENALPKKCSIEGLRMKVTVPIKILCILNAGVVLMTAWGGMNTDLCG